MKDTDCDYRLPLPTPAQAKSLAEGIEAAISPVITSLAELATANASGDPSTIASAADAVIGKFTTAVEANLAIEADDDGLTLNFPIPVPADSVGKSLGDRFNIYDLFFEVNRLPESATNAQALEALTVALAVVMKDAAKAESEKRGVTTIEFGLLRQALAVVIEVLIETETITE